MTKIKNAQKKDNGLTLVRPYMESINTNGDLVQFHPQYATNNYGILLEHPMNRESDNNHVSEVGEAIASNGWLGDIQVALLDGKYYYIDGTHRAKWLKQKGHTIVFTLKIVKSEEELLNLMIAANNVNKTWSLTRYVEANAKRGKESYIELLKVITSDNTYMPPACAAAVLGTVSVALAKTTIKKGTYYIPNIKEGNRTFDLIDTFLKNANQGTNSRTIEGLLQFIGNIGLPVFRSIHKEYAIAVDNYRKSVPMSKTGAKDFEKMFMVVYRSFE